MGERPKATTSLFGCGGNVGDPVAQRRVADAQLTDDASERAHSSVWLGCCTPVPALDAGVIPPVQRGIDGSLISAVAWLPFVVYLLSGQVLEFF